MLHLEYTQIHLRNGSVPAALYRFKLTAQLGQHTSLPSARMVVQVWAGTACIDSSGSSS
jgi:hypothetical protein